MNEKERTRQEAAPRELYAAPRIVWEEVLEEAGVYAGCAKDAFGEMGLGCLARPTAGAS
jgi:hypothetical protein